MYAYTMVKHHVQKAIHDGCYNRIKAQYRVWPSARASQALAKCRRNHGHVRKTAAGTSLRRWQREKWTTAGGKPCGAKGSDGAYCRPTKHVSQQTPTLKQSLSKSRLAAKAAEKRRVGPGHRVTSTRKH